MTQSLVQSLVMHALATPAFLRQLKDGGAVPELAADQQAMAATLDAQRLYLFAGFLARVQNNPLRLLIPWTLELLARLDLEIEAFAAYREQFLKLRAQGPLSSAERLEAFASFLADFVAGTPWQDLIGACLGHERIIVELAGEAMTEGPVASPRSPQAIPILCGRQRMKDFSCDPDGLVRLLRADPAQPDAPGLDAQALASLRRPTTMLYWLRASKAPVLAVPIDPISAALLRAIDGRRPIAAIGAATAIDPRIVTTFFDTAVRQGLVVFVNPGAPP